MEKTALYTQKWVKLSAIWTNMGGRTIYQCIIIIVIFGTVENTHTYVITHSFIYTRKIAAFKIQIRSIVLLMNLMWCTLFHRKYTISCASFVSQWEFCQNASLFICLFVCLILALINTDQWLGNLSWLQNGWNDLPIENWNQFWITKNGHIQFWL